MLAVADGEAIRPLIASLRCVDLGRCPQLRAENVSRETFSALIFLRFSVISVLVALLGGWTIQQNRPFSAQPIDLRGFEFALGIVSSSLWFLSDILSLIITINFFRGYFAKNFKKISIFTTKKLKM